MLPLRTRHDTTPPGFLDQVQELKQKTNAIYENLFTNPKNVKPKHL